MSRALLFSGSRLRQARQSRGVTREVLAGQIDRSVSVIRKYEAGEAVPSTVVVGRLAWALGVQAGELFTEREETEHDRAADTARREVRALVETLPRLSSAGQARMAAIFARPNV